MIQAREAHPPLLRPTPVVRYHHGLVADALQQSGTLAVLRFGNTVAEPVHDPRCLDVPLHGLADTTPLELWQVDDEVVSGSDGVLRWSSGGGWLFAAVDIDERDHGGPCAAAEWAYAHLQTLVAKQPARHVLRIWNYLGAINHGSGDDERYKRFCEGRARGMGRVFDEGFPAASAIGYPGEAARLQVYLLACDQPGTRVENPRQVSAWRYPRQYGPTPPSFARAMTLPARDALAISGTAAVVGHASTHHDNLHAQLEETLANLDALLESAGFATGFDTRSPLKVYVRHAHDAPQVRSFLQHRLPGVPLLLLHGDICRRELLVEIDGWRYAPAP